MASSAGGKRDPNTNSNYDKFRTRHTAIDVELDFANKRLSGEVELQMEAMGASDEVILDTSYLTIQDIKVDGQACKWEVKARIEPYGSPLHIAVGAREAGDTFKVAVKVQTTEQCTALQWFGPQQTPDGQHPYVFSQCQAIHGRSVFPCQDTPDVKSTFGIRIRSQLPVVASGLPTGAHEFRPATDGGRGTLLYTFDQAIPIPSYLFALASGDIASASIGARSSVVTGPSQLAAAKWEFEADVDRIMAAAEKTLHPVKYAWTQYNVLVLPPSFPYGGMENPVFTFATPTAVAGNRQQVGLIAHELSHSWSGNLVTNCSWEHFWLNEGWTVYLQRRIAEELDGNSARDFNAIIGWKSLTDAVNGFGADHEFTKLVHDLKGKDPDDSFSTVPYEKGSTFLRYLDTLVGRAAWDRFIPHYFGKFARRSLDSFEFRDTLLAFFASDAAASEKLKAVDWDTWFFKPGMPPKPDFDTSMVDVVYALADRWERRAAGKESFEPTAADVEGLTANQLVVFLERCDEAATPLREEDTRAMDKAYGFVSAGDAEVSTRYMRLALKSGNRDAVDPTVAILGKIGRFKMVRPLYNSLAAVDRDLALKTFEANKSFYHPICVQIVRKALYGS